MTARDRLNGTTLAAEEDRAKGEKVMGFVHACVWCLRLEGDGMESLGGDDPRPMPLEKLGISLPRSTIVLDEPAAYGPWHAPRAVGGRGGVLSVVD